jgi:hypothetical protein
MMYTQFNKMAIEFLSRMEKTYPHESKISLYKIKYEMLQSMNAKKPVEMFMESMLPFGEQILSKNEMFFQQDEFVGSAENISGKIGLVKYWENMEQSTKNAIWEYIQGLYILGMGSLEYTDELKIMIKKTGFKG